MPGPKESPQPNQQEKVVLSDDILDGRSEIVIDHHGVSYRLRVTRQDKLILTK